MAFTLNMSAQNSLGLTKREAKKHIKSDLGVKFQKGYTSTNTMYFKFNLGSTSLYYYFNNNKVYMIKMFAPIDDDDVYKSLVEKYDYDAAKDMWYYNNIKVYRYQENYWMVYLLTKR